MVFIVQQLAVSIVGEDSQLEKDLVAAGEKVKRWAARGFDAPAIRVNTQPAQESVKQMGSLAVQQAKQAGQLAAQTARSQAALAVAVARQTSQLRIVDVRETEQAEREKVRTKGAADRESLRTRITALRTETAEARIQAQVQIKIARDTAKQREQIWKAVERGGQAAGNIGQSATYGVSLPLLALGKAALDANVRMDSLKRGLVAVNGSAAAANAQFEKLRQVAKLPGLTLEQAVQGDVQLQAAGLSAEQSTKSLMAFGNALATVGKGGAEHLGLVNLALSQIASSSRVSGQDVRQLQEQIPQLRQAMLKVFGTADTIQLGKMGIDPKVFVQKITDELAKLPQVTGGIQNDIENAEDKINISLGRIGGAIARVGAGPLEHFTDEVDHVTTAFSNLSTEGQDALIKVAVGVAVGGPLLIGIGRVAEAVTSVRNLYMSLPSVAAKAAAAQATAAETAAAAQVAGVGEAAAASEAASVSTLAAWGPAGLVMAALAALGIELVHLAGYWDDMKKAEDQAAQSARDYADVQKRIAGQGELGALTVNRQQIGQGRAVAKEQIDNQRQYLRQMAALRKKGDNLDYSNLLGEFQSNPIIDDPTIGRYRKFGGSLGRVGQAVPPPSLASLTQWYVKAGRDDATEAARQRDLRGVGAGKADAALTLSGDSMPGYLKTMLSDVGQHVGYQCGEAVSKALKANGVTDTATALLKAAQKDPSMRVHPDAKGNYPAGTILFFGDPSKVNQKGNHQHFAVAYGNGMLAENTTAGGGGDHYRADQTVAHVSANFRGRVFGFAPKGTLGSGTPPPPPDASAISAQQDFQKQYIAATQGKYAADRYQAKIDYAGNKQQFDPKKAWVIYQKALADIHTEELQDQTKQHKKLETAADKHHKKMLADATKYVKGQLAIYNDWYKKSVATGKQVDAANAIDAKNKDFAEAGTPAQFAREKANANAEYARQTKNPYVDQKIAQAARDKTLADIEDRRKEAADAAAARAQEKRDNTPKGRAAKTLAAFGDEMKDRTRAAQADVLGDDVESSWQKALASSKELRDAIALDGKAAKDAHTQFVQMFDAEKTAKDAKDLTSLQKQLTDALADSNAAYDKVNGHVDRYGDILARLNISLKDLTPAERAATEAMLPQIAAVDAATAKMQRYHDMMRKVQEQLQGSLSNVFEKILSGSKVTFKEVADDFKMMVIRIIAETEAAKLAAYLTGKNGLGGIAGGILGGNQSDPTKPDTGGKNAASNPSGVLGLVGMALPAYLAMKNKGSEASSSVPTFGTMPGSAPGAAGGGTDWLATASAIAPAFGPQGAAIGAGIGLFGSIFGKKKSAPTPSLPGVPGTGQGVVPVYVVGIAGMTGGGGLPGQPGGGGGGLGSILGIASSFLPGAGVLGKIFHFASGVASVPGNGASDTVPAYLTPGEMILSRGMLNGSMPAPALPAPVLLHQLPNAGHGALVSALAEALARSSGGRPVQITATQQIGTVNHEADENRLMSGFGRNLEALAATY